ncbi:MAG: esterase/lipase family protein [Microbacterium sp.]|uniref:esterase/lipase family protein n=1 Tax=Microbacterium sp. TaxID=51671 RepID=UPI003D6FA414
MLAIPASASAATYPDAVLLVSGFDTASPFTTPDPSCDGKEGPEWNPAGGIAKTLKPAGLDVFTAPVRQTGGSLLPPCSGPGELVPPDAVVIDSNGEADANGRALANLIGFLRDAYGLERLQIVGHSDGGLWSRSAITQDGAYAGVEVLSLTTLGTPHTGSLVADLAIQLNGGKCDFSNEIEQLICDGVVEVAQLMLKDLGEVATTELTNGFLTGWNPKQRIGSCPVTGIAGDGVGFDLAGFEYYTPNDGAVGLASALGEASRAIDGSTIPAPGIPNFRQGGTYDVVHGEVLDFLSAQNLLNTQAISDEVRDTVIVNASTTTPCNEGAGEREPGTTRLGLPLYRFDAPNRRGLLPRPDPGEFVAAQDGVGVKCGRTHLDRTIHRGDSRIQLFETFACDKRLRVTKSAGTAATASDKASLRGKAVLLDHAERNSVVLRVDGAVVRIKVRGAKVRKLRVTAWAGGRRQRLALDRKGSATLPDAGERTWLRIRARTKPGWVVSSANTTLSR